MKINLQRNALVWHILVFLLANGLLLIAPPTSALRDIAALFLLFFIPGWVWLPVFLNHPLDSAGRLTLAVGLSLAFSALAAIAAVYLPGALTANQVWLTVNALTLAGLIFSWRTSRSPGGGSMAWPVMIGLAALILLAVVLRFPRLGYAEFHEDEAEALMLGVRLFQGEDYALFLHRKGPAQMLVPVAVWLLAGHITETLARFPFALSSVLSVVTLFLIGRRWFGWTAGILAALLWAVHGYAIGFGRMVQYQALIFFLGPLAIYALYLAWNNRQSRLQIAAAILLAVCLLAHFDALLLLPAAAYLWLLLIRQNQRLVTAISLLIFLTLLAAFYIPYLLDPEFSNTAAYLSESRVKPGLLYNNLDVLRRLDQEYSSHFYLPLLAGGLIAFVVWQSQRLAAKGRWIVAGLGVLAASTWFWPNLWQADTFSLALFPWILWGLFWIWISPTVEARTAWILGGAPFMGYVFLVDDPRTHLYILYPGAILMAGAGWAWLLDAANRWHIKGNNVLLKNKFRPLALLLLLFGVVLLGLIGGYAVIIFLSNESGLTQTRQQWDGSLAEVVYDDLPDTRDYFGYPKKEGWKAIGALRAQGHFPGDFRSMNEDFIIPIWYNYSQARSCYNTPAQYFVRAPGLETIPTVRGYAETARIERENEVRLRIFSAGAAPPQPVPLYPVEEWETAFDRQATPLNFARQADPAKMVEAVFGSAIKFVGYTLPSATVAPGDTLYLDLYWRALAEPGDNYRAFVHLTDGATLWAQQDDDPACRLPTSVWRTGQRGRGQFRLQLDPATPPGRYPLIIGLYHAGTLERLPLTAGTAGQPGDDFLWLQDIQVIE